jgi:hypothetical protein
VAPFRAAKKRPGQFPGAGLSLLYYYYYYYYYSA